jgi:hypothetical protein
VAISNHRLLSVDGDHVTFRWKDYAHHSKCRAMTLTSEEFCAASYSMFCPRVFPASATLAGSLIAAAGSCCRFAEAYSRSHLRLPKPTALQPLSGSVRSAVAQCALWSC